jgi:hypothetical protein
MERRYGEAKLQPPEWSEGTDPEATSSPLQIPSTPVGTLLRLQRDDVRLRGDMDQQPTKTHLLPPSS